MLALSALCAFPVSSMLPGFPVAACLPEAKGAALGKVPLGSPAWERIAAEAARTVPGRGGNRGVHQACCV